MLKVKDEAEKDLCSCWFPMGAMDPGSKGPMSLAVVSSNARSGSAILISDQCNS